MDRAASWREVKRLTDELVELHLKLAAALPHDPAEVGRLDVEIFKKQRRRREILEVDLDIKFPPE